MANHTLNLELNNENRLKPIPEIEVTDDDVVDWQIISNGIESFHIRGKFLTHHHPFTIRPSSHLQSWLRLIIARHKHEFTWHYSVVYKLKGNPKKHVLDPKMRIKPTTHESGLTFVVALITAAVITTIVIRTIYLNKKQLQQNKEF